MLTELYSCGGGKCTTQAADAGKAFDAASRHLGRPENQCNNQLDPTAPVVELLPRFIQQVRHLIYAEE